MCRDFHLYLGKNKTMRDLEEKSRTKKEMIKIQHILAKYCFESKFGLVLAFWGVCFHLRDRLTPLLSCLCQLNKILESC